jgi:hypothetical protein
MDKRKKRSNPAMGQAGNYAAPVDTAGMDPEMKKSLGVNKPRKKQGFFEMLRNAGKQNK